MDAWPTAVPMRRYLFHLFGHGPAWLNSGHGETSRPKDEDVSFARE